MITKEVTRWLRKRQRKRERLKGARDNIYLLLNDKWWAFVDRVNAFWYFGSFCYKEDY